MSVSFQTNKTGAAATVCSTSTIKYNFSVAENTVAEKATFAMSRGTSTTASCTVAIYNQPNGGGSVIASVTLPASSFVSSSYPDVVFTFPANTNLSVNTDYSLVITSSTGCNGANAYSLKPGSFQVIDTITAQVLNTGYAIAAAPSGHVSTTASARASFVLSSANVAVAALTVAPAADIAIAANFENSVRMDGAATGEYALTAGPAARASLFASTEPFLFAESEITCESVTTAAALQNVTMQTLAQMIASVSASAALQAGATTGFYRGPQQVTNLYIGSIRITKAYIGSTLLLANTN